MSGGIGPRQLLRILQWAVGIPIAVSFFIALVSPGLPDPFVWLLEPWFGSEWGVRLALFGVAAGLEFSNLAVVQAEGIYETKLIEIVKGIGDRLRAGAATETAVAEVVRDKTTGPAVVFVRAITLSDEMPFDAALRLAADQSGSAYLREVAYLVAEAVASEGDAGSAIRRLSVELERGQQYAVKVTAKLSTPIMVMRGIGLFAVPPMYALLRWAFGGIQGEGGVEAGARLFLLYGAVIITLFDWLVFGRWERIFARMPLGLAAVWCGLNWI